MLINNEVKDRAKEEEELKADKLELKLQKV